jgi:uridine kinase
MGLQQTKKLLHSKENDQQSEEATYRMGKIFTSYLSNRGLISRIYKEFKKCKKATNDPIKKWGKYVNRHFSKDVQMAKKYMKNVQHDQSSEK